MFKYTLQPYKNLSSRHLCPQCGKKEFTLYIDTETGNLIHPTVGRCNRENNCGYHFKPKQYFEDNKIESYDKYIYNPNHKQLIQKTKKPDFIPFSIFIASLKNYENNNFITFLITSFGESTTNQLIEKYYIATSRHWQGATVFYQIDHENKIRTAKVMLYNAQSGKRVKQPFDHVNWLHRLLKIEDFMLSQCLFGEHLLTDKTKTVAIVESEKTAIISSVYLPEFIWLATGGKNNMKPELFRNLHNRKVVFFPDLKAFDLWSEKAKELGLKNHSISDLLETKALEEEKQQGLDLADYLLKYDAKQFRLKALINQQFSKFHHECWIIDIEKDLPLTNYNLQVLCDNINIPNNTNFTPDEYYESFLS